MLVEAARGRLNSLCVSGLILPSRNGSDPLHNIPKNRLYPLRTDNSCELRVLQEDHRRSIAAVIRKLAADWKRPLGRPIHTWLRAAVETDLGQLNVGLASARGRLLFVKTGGALWTQQRSSCMCYQMKRALRETQTLRAGCSKAEPKIFAPPLTPFPGARDGQN